MRNKLLNGLWFYFMSITVAFASDIWVDAINGDDNRDGLSASNALRTLQTAANQAMPGTVVHIQPGIYREMIRPTHSGNTGEPIIYRAEAGADTVKIRGSETVTHWTRLIENQIGLPARVDPQQIVWTDLSAWGLTQAPRFVALLDASGHIIARLTIAKEPDWTVQTEWKFHEFWWAAQGGHEIAACNPITDKPASSCDDASRSFTQLTDQQEDFEPTGIEPGNLTSLGDLTGATLVVMETYQGENVFRRRIIAHEVAAGRVTVDQPAKRESNNNDEGLGWGSKYYVENHPALLDNPGEYWFDVNTGRLYLWPLTADLADLAQIEISQRENGWDLTGLSYLQLEDLTLEFFNNQAIVLQNDVQQASTGLQLRNLQLRYANQGLFVKQDLNTASSSYAVVDGLVLENSVIGYMDNEGIELKGEWKNDSTSNDPASFTHAPITDILLRNNTFHHLGFYASQRESGGLVFHFADNLRLENNHIHHLAHHGLLFFGSVIDSKKTFDFTSDEIKTGDILLDNNLIEYTCQVISECSAITFVGTPPQSHVFRNVLLINNTLRHIYGWSYVAEKRGLWADGYFAYGLFAQDASGLHAYRNLVYNIGLAGFFITRNWRDGPIVLANNLAASAMQGINIWNPSDMDTRHSVNTQIINNLIVNNGSFGIQHPAALEDNQFILDHNLYYANGWDAKNGGTLNLVRGDSYEKIDEVQENTVWETHGLSQAPAFFSYDYHNERQLGSQTVLDFDLKTTSAAIDRGSETLPASLQSLLDYFGILTEVQNGTAWDIGPVEYQPSRQPSMQQGLALATGTLQSQTTTSQFSGFVTTGFVTTTLGQRGNGLTFSPYDTIKIMAEMKVAPEDLGKTGHLVMIAGYTPSVENSTTGFFIREGKTWHPWDGSVNQLPAAEIEANLPTPFELFDQLEMTIYEGTFTGFDGHFIIYVGYLLSDGTLVFNGQQPITFTIHPF